jgi:hypothetical protein
VGGVALRSAGESHAGWTKSSMKNEIFASDGIFASVFHSR